MEVAKHIFEPRTIQRMELLVLSVLDWRLRSITPFSFIAYFACKLDSAGTYAGFLVSRATEIILSNIQGKYILILLGTYMHAHMYVYVRIGIWGQKGSFFYNKIERILFLFYDVSTEASFLEYWPSCIAAAAILCAASEIPNLSLVNPEHAESWCDGLHKVSM